MHKIRLVSHNIHKGKSALGQRDSLEDLRLALYGLSPDLVFLQEIQGRNEIAGHLNEQPTSLGAALNMQVAYGCNAVREKTDHGNALLSKFMIESFENQDISDHRLEQRGLLHAIINIDRVIVHCFVVHLGLFYGSRVRQIKALSKRISDLVPNNEKIIIAGDFNDWHDKLSPILINELGLEDVFSNPLRRPEQEYSRLRHSITRLGHNVGATIKNALPNVNLPNAFTHPEHRILQLPYGNEKYKVVLPPPRTFPAAFPLLRLDRVYQRGFSVSSSKVLRGKPWNKISDHAPLFVELDML